MRLVTRFELIAEVARRVSSSTFKRFLYYEPYGPARAVLVFSNTYEGRTH